MKKLFIMLASLSLTAAMVVPASALTFDIGAPGNPAYGNVTSVEVIHTADGGAQKNEDLSKNAALVPPGFVTPSADILNTGTPLTPNLVPGYTPAAGAMIDSGSVLIQPPDLNFVPATSVTSVGSTEVTADLYYSGGHLGTLSIPSLGVNVKIYEGTDSSTLAKGAGHFTESSIWFGNVALAAHNRGVNAYFGQIHTLELGDKITLTTKLGTRTYAVTSVSKVSETDRSGLAASESNILTLYTCVRDQREYRWCITAQEVV